MEASQEKKRQKKKDDIELKLEEFYNSLEEDEKLEKLEDIRRLAGESKELLRKVDALVELLLRAAQEPDTEQSEVLLHIQKISDDLDDVLNRLKVLDDLQAELKKHPELLESISADLSAVKQSVSALGDSLNQKLAVLPSLSEKMDTLSSKASEADSRLATLSSVLQDVRGEIAAIRDIQSKLSSLENALDSLPDTVSAELSQKLDALDKRLDSVVSSIGGISTRLSDIDSSLRELLKIQSRLDVLEEIEKSVASAPDAVSESVLSALRSELDSIREKLAALSDEVSTSSSTAALIRADLEPVSERLERIESELQALSALKDLKEHLDSSISSAKSDILSAISSDHEELLKKLSDLEKISSALDEIRSYIKKQYAENEWASQQFSELEKELAALNLAVDSIHKVIDGDVDQRKEALSHLSERLEEVLSKLSTIQMHAGEDTAQRIAELQTSLKSLSQQISDAYEKILQAESKNASLYEELLKTLDSRLSALEAELENDPSRATASAVRKELEQISQQLTNVTDILVQDHGLLSKHSGTAAELLSRVQVLQARVDELSGSVGAISDLSERQKQIESLLDSLHGDVSSLRRQLRDLKASDLHKKLDDLKTSISVVNSEIMGVMELLKRYDVSSQLKEIVNSLSKLSEAVDSQKISREQASAEIARLEEELARISDILSSADLEHLKNRLETIHADVLAVHDRIKSARAILGEEDLKGILKDLEAMRAAVRKFRDYGLSDEIDELHSKILRLKKELAEHVDAVEKGNIHHSALADRHVAVMKVAKPLVDTSAMVAAVASVHGSHAKEIKRNARKIAKYTGSVHAHLVAAHADRIVAHAKAAKDVERLARKINKELEKTQRTISSKRGIVTAGASSVDPEKAVLNRVLKYVSHMRPGDSISIADLAEELGVPKGVLQRVLAKLVHSGERRLRFRRPILGLFGDPILEKY